MVIVTDIEMLMNSADMELIEAVVAEGIGVIKMSFANMKVTTQLA